jgi:hypothetical protein
MQIESKYLSLALKEEARLEACEKKVLKTLFLSEREKVFGWKVFYSTKLHNHR